jgi:FkbM family methyltransferase
LGIFEKYRLFRKYADPNRYFIMMLFKSFWINLIVKTKIILWHDQIKWIVSRDFQSTKNPYYYGISDKEEFQLIDLVCKPGDVFFDIGANIGLYSIYFSKIKKLQCYQFEPNESARAINLKIQVLNAITYLNTLLPYALSNKNGQSYFTNNQDINNHLSDQVTGLKVDVKRLDDLNDLPEAHIIKIDTELEDYKVLLGAQRFLQSQCLKAIILEYNTSELQKVINLLSNYSFECIRMNKYKIIPNEDFHPSKAGNLLFIKRNLKL